MTVDDTDPDADPAALREDFLRRWLPRFRAGAVATGAAASEPPVAFAWFDPPPVVANAVGDRPTWFAVWVAVGD